MAEMLYIYYRVPMAHHAQALPAAQALLASVTHDTGCQAQLSCRCDDPQTWMETYSDFADREALLHSIARALAVSGLDALVEPPGRHLECFKRL